MKIISTKLEAVKILIPDVFEDARGYFLESFNENNFSEHTGVKTRFVQDNHSHSVKNVLRGLHYQIKHPQGKLIRVVNGEIFDVAVDLRSSSATFGNWVSMNLSAANKHIAWIPQGFAHGFLVLSNTADVIYKTTDYYYPEHERCLRWDDSTVNIKWPLDYGIMPILSQKDNEKSKNIINVEKFI